MREGTLFLDQGFLEAWYSMNLDAKSTFCDWKKAFRLLTLEVWVNCRKSWWIEHVPCKVLWNLLSISRYVSAKLWLIPDRQRKPENAKVLQKAEVLKVFLISCIKCPSIHRLYRNRLEHALSKMSLSERNQLFLLLNNRKNTLQKVLITP